jgi:hypothetical protein
VSVAVGVATEFDSVVMSWRIPSDGANGDSPRRTVSSGG